MSFVQPYLGTYGAVCASNHLAAAAGMAMLEKGGNAFDAAAAVAFVLQVVEPDQNGPGGESVAVFYSAKDRDVRVLCGQGVAPDAACPSRFAEIGLDHVPGTGLLPAVTPGNLDAWLLLLRNYGALPLSAVLEPAISYAMKGFPLSPRTAAHIDKFQARFATAWHTTARVFLPGGALPKPNQLIRNEDLGMTLSRIVTEAGAGSCERSEIIEAARKVVATGFICEEIDRFCREDVVYDFRTRATARALLSGSDMARWRASIERPVSYPYGRWTLFKPGPWSQGPVLLQQLAILKHRGLHNLDVGGAEFVHTVVETAKLAFADKAAYYGDPLFTDVPLDHLLGDGYNARRSQLLGEAASPGFACGEVPRHEGKAELLRSLVQRLLDQADRAHVKPRPEKCTVHFDVADSSGNMVAATQSGGWFHDSPLIPSLGFALSTRGQMFSLLEASPNCIAPRKRPLTTLSPTLAFRDRQPHMIFGTPGADQQDQWSLIFFLRYAHGMNIAEANQAPLFHTRHLLRSFHPQRFVAMTVFAEDTMPTDVVAQLDARGHKVELMPTFSNYTSPLNFGTLSSVTRDGPLLAAAGSARWPCSFAVAR
jgi:gamma-glutamyltranspeptidase / glutathione hydrolase